MKELQEAAEPSPAKGDSKKSLKIVPTEWERGRYGRISMVPLARIAARCNQHVGCMDSRAVVVTVSRCLDMQCLGKAYGYVANGIKLAREFTMTMCCIMSGATWAGTTFFPEIGKAILELFQKCDYNLLQVDKQSAIDQQLRTRLSKFVSPQRRSRNVGWHFTHHITTQLLAPQKNRRPRQILCDTRPPERNSTLHILSLLIIFKILLVKLRLDSSW